MRRIRTRKSFVSMLLVIAVTVTAVLGGFAVTLNDISGHWGKAAIETVAEGGLVEGNPDGSFKPNASITRAELATIICRAEGLETGAENGYWAYKAIYHCINTLKCMPDFGEITNANYGVACTRELAAYMLVNSIGSNNPDAARDVTIKDIPDYHKVNTQYKNAVLEAYQLGLCKGMDDKGTFEPQGSFTRAQVAQMLVNANVTTAAEIKGEEKEPEPTVTPGQSVTTPTAPVGGKLSAGDIARLREYERTLTSAPTTYERAKKTMDAENLWFHYGDRSGMGTFQGAHDFLYTGVDENEYIVLKRNFDDLGKVVIPSSVEEFFQLLLKETVAELEYKSDNLVIKFYTDEELLYHPDDMSGMYCTVRGVLELTIINAPAKWTQADRDAFYALGLTKGKLGGPWHWDVDVHMHTPAYLTQSHNICLDHIVLLSEMY